MIKRYINLVFKVFTFYFLQILLYVLVEIGIALLCDMTKCEKDTGLSVQTYMLEYNTYIYCAVCIVTLFIFYILFYKNPKKIVKKICAIKKSDVIMLFGIGIITSFLFNCPILFSTTPIEESVEMKLLEYIVYFISVVIITPLIEELLYREIIYNEISKINGKALGMLISTFLFWTVHGITIDNSYIIIMGVIYSFAYEKKGGVTASLILHMAFNFTAIIIGLI